MHVAIIEPLGVERSLVERLMGEVAGVTFDYFDQRSVDPDELARRARGAEAVVVANAPVTERMLAQCPDLRMLSVAFTGLDHIDLAYCDEHGVEVVNCAGYSTEAVAEEVFGLALSLYRHLGECDRRVRAGADRAGLTFRELRGKTLGLVGNGAIACRVMEIARAFGMELLCHARTERPLEGVTYVGLAELCRHADVLSLHVPATPSTTHLIGERELSLMKPDAILINCARGPVVDTDALVQALEEERIAGAGLDVFDAEPPLDPALPILAVAGTQLAPHIGFATVEALAERARLAIEHVSDYVRSSRHAAGA